MAAAKKSSTPIMDAIDMSQTYNPLLMALHENDKHNLFSTNVVTMYHKTGFPVFDYYFGTVINIHDELGKIVRQEPRVGQAAGTFNLIIGNSGSGKTTLAAQIVANIIRQYPYANCIHYDCEHRFELSRAETITKLPSYFFDGSRGPERYMIKTGMVSLDTIQKMIVDTYAQKMRLKDQMMVPSGFKNEFGKEIMIFQPTFIIIDSITSVIETTFSVDSAKDISEAEKLRGNTEGARDAKTMKGFLKEVLPMCKEANITIYGINHINTNMSMNAFIPVAKQQNYLKQDEIIPGGKTMIYYPFNIIKLIAKPSDDFTMDSDGFDGHIVMVEPIKSSSNQSGNNSKGVSFEMIFSFKEGFDSLRTMIHYGRTYGLIEGNKNRMKFKGDDSFTFNWKNLNEEKKEKPIWPSLRTVVYPNLNTHLSWLEPTDNVFDENVLNY